MRSIFHGERKQRMATVFQQATKQRTKAKRHVLEPDGHQELDPDASPGPFLASDDGKYC